MWSCGWHRTLGTKKLPLTAGKQAQLCFAPFNYFLHWPDRSLSHVLDLGKHARKRAIDGCCWASQIATVTIKRRLVPISTLITTRCIDGGVFCGSESPRPMAEAESFLRRLKVRRSVCVEMTTFTNNTYIWPPGRYLSGRRDLMFLSCNRQAIQDASRWRRVEEMWRLIWSRPRYCLLI